MDRENKEFLTQQEPSTTSQESSSKENLPPEEENLSFSEMLAQHEQEEEPQLRLQPGDKVTVRIVAITGDTVFVSTGSKIDGIVDREELEVNGELPYQVDDTLSLYVVTANPYEVRLSKALSGVGSLEMLEQAQAAELPVEGKVLAQTKGGYAVNIMKRRAFCPLSQIDLHPPVDPEEHVGKTYFFRIIRLENNGRNLVISRRALLEQERDRNREEALATIHVGDTVEGTISRLAPFGAFATIAPDVEGLIHISELSWAHLTNPDEAVSIGDKVRVKVLQIETDPKNTKISLSIKQVTDDPWKNVTERLHTGDVVEGKVVRTAPFGAFVEVLPGIEGLVHISELSYIRRITKTEDVVVAGDHVSVMIKEIDPQKKRLSLSVREVAGDPWKNVNETFSVNSDVLGTLEKRAPFGMFITLAPGITGLLPNSALQGKDRKQFDKFNPGDAIAVRIKEIDSVNRKISLSPQTEETRGDDDKNWKEHAPKPEKQSFGSLGLALQQAVELKKKKN